MKRLYTSKRNLCPVCGNHHGCAIREDNLIECLRSASQQDAPKGYRFVKLLRNGMGGLFALDSGEQRHEPRHDRQQQKKKAAAERLQGALPVPERDRAIRKLHCYFSLGSKHRQDLRVRGLTDVQIDAYLAFSVYPDQELPPNIPANLPGVTRRGDRLYAKGTGYACPSFDLEGRVNGWQIRYDNPEEAGGKYKWPTNPHLPSEELPITVCRPLGGITNPGVRLSEGFLKPFIAAQKTGQITIGSPNGQLAASPEQTLAALETYCTDRSVAITPDAGDVSNGQVMRRWLDQIEWLREQGYAVSIEWWGQTTKDAPDIDELTGDETIAYISPDDFFAIAREHGGIRDPQEQGDRPISRDEWELKYGFGKFLKSRLNKLVKGFGARPETRVRPLGLRTSEDGVIEFQPGERRRTIAQLRSQGVKFILDRSPTGSGKSHDAGATHPDENSNGKVWYLAANHRNPTVETVEQMQDLQPRHNGQVIEAGKLTPLGSPYIRNPRRGENTDSLDLEMTPGNCHRADWFSALRAKGYNPEIEQADGRNPICGGCPELHGCIKGGFLFERKEVLKARRIRAHIESLPQPTEFDYSQDIAFVDEADQLTRATQVIEAQSNEIDALWGRLEREKPDAFEALKPFRIALGEALQGEFDVVQNGRNRGANHEVLLSNLPSPGTIPNLEEAINGVRQASPRLRELFVEADSVTGVGGRWRQAGDFARSHFRREAAAETLANIQTAPTNILIHILEVWTGLKQGSLRCYRGKLTATIRDTRNADILRAFSRTILMDATADKAVLARKLNIDASEIVEIREASPQPNNLTAVNVEMPGMGSNEVSDACKQRQISLLGAICSRHEGQSVKLLANKSDTHLPLDGYWFRDNRGSNEFSGTDVLVCFNTPRPNLGAIQDEYRAIFGSLEGFWQYYQHLTAAEIVQLVGRPRANLYPNKQITVYLVGTGLDLEFLKQYGIKVCSVEAFQLCPEAGTPAQITRWKILEASRTIKEQGGKLTQVAIAEVAGKSQELISKLAKEFGGWQQMKKLLLALLQPYRGSNNFSALTQEERWLAESYLPSLLQESPEVAVEEIGQMIRAVGVRRFLRMLTAATPQTQARLLRWVLQALPVKLQLDLPSLEECT